MATEFSLFSFLPWELRRMIWLECTESRVVELEVPPEMYLSGHSITCVSWTAHQNTRPPVVSRVCHESRQAVLSQCARALDDQETRERADSYITTQSPWFHPGKDIVTFSSLKCIYPYDLEIDGETSYFIAYAKQAKDVVIPARLIYPLRHLRLPMEQGEFRSIIPRVVADQLAPLKSFMVCLKTIEVHMPPEEFLKSTLSGRTGDSLVHIVDVFDMAQIEQILGEVENACPQEKDVLSAFALLRDSEKLHEEVGIWQEEARKNWLCQMYGCTHSDDQRAYDEANGIPERNPECFVGPPGEDFSVEKLSREQFIELYRQKPPRFDKFGFDMEDPWVQWAKDQVPTFRPVIMFRLCVGNCASLRSTYFRRQLFSGRYPGDYSQSLMSQYSKVRFTEWNSEGEMAADKRKVVKRLQ